MRQLAIIPNDGGPSKVKHYAGLPPELTGGTDSRQVLGNACFLVIEEKPDGIFLYRYEAKGECVGDTWHMSVDDAKHQAVYEYGDEVKAWIDIPPEVGDVVAFGMNRLASVR